MRYSSLIVLCLAQSRYATRGVSLKGTLDSEKLCYYRNTFVGQYYTGTGPWHTFIIVDAGIIRITHRDSGMSLSPTLLALLLFSFAQISFLLHLLDPSWLAREIRKIPLRIHHLCVLLNYNCPGRIAFTPISPLYSFKANLISHSFIAKWTHKNISFSFCNSHQ